MFSMNRAAATISGIRRSLFMRARGSKRAVERGCSTDRAIPLLRNRQAFLNPWRVLGGQTMIYVLAALLPPIGLLFNGQPFSAILNVVVIVLCAILGWIFPILFLVPSAHALIAVHMKREDRRHREVGDAIREHGPPPNYPR